MPSYRVWILGVALAVDILAAHAADTPAKQKAWQFSGMLRSRVEAWDWFNPGTPAVGKDHSYTYMGNLLRLAASRQTKRADILVEVSAPLLLGLPKDAVAAAPQGQLGLGAAYRAANGDRLAYLFVKQACVTIKGIAGKGTNLRLGRFEFMEGMEALIQDPTLDWLKRERTANRLISNFGFTHIQRSVDGLQLAHSSKGTNLTVVAARPTVGVFELNGNKNVPNVEFVYAGLTHTGSKRHYDGRLFYIYYRDDRGALKTDNRPLPLRGADTGAISVSTLGANYTRKLGPADILAWGAWQGGDWGKLNQRSWAWAIELGYQPKVRWKPWLRGGTNRSSGDRNTADGRHETFFQLLPTPRAYARFPFFNMMNTEDDFAEVILRPGSRATIRTDYRRLRLSKAADLWYSGGGAFQKRTFGFAGRPGGGSRDLSTLSDVSLDVRIFSRTTLTLYYGHADGGRVIRTIYPAGPTGNLAYWELVQRF